MKVRNQGWWWLALPVAVLIVVGGLLARAAYQPRSKNKVAQASGATVSETVVKATIQMSPVVSVAERSAIAPVVNKSVIVRPKPVAKGRVKQYLPVGKDGHRYWQWSDDDFIHFEK